jgi:hypothetical protein
MSCGKESNVFRTYRSAIVGAAKVDPACAAELVWLVVGTKFFETGGRVLVSAKGGDARETILDVRIGQPRGDGCYDPVFVPDGSWLVRDAAGNVFALAGPAFEALFSEAVSEAADELVM